MKIHQLCLAIGLVLVAGHASAEDFKVGTLAVENPWSRATPIGATVGGGYLAIQNTGTQSDRLPGGDVEAAKTSQIHNMTMDGDVAKMREVTDGVEITPGQTVKFEPGATHLMFVGLTQPLRAGQKLSGTLRFEHAGIVYIEYEIVPIGGETRRNALSQAKGFRAIALRPAHGSRLEPQMVVFGRSGRSCGWYSASG